MNLIPTSIDKCFQIHPIFVEDERGSFVKSFHSEIFKELGLPTVWREDFYTRSKKGVIRGMHFQTPPYDHQTLVYCN